MSLRSASLCLLAALCCPAAFGVELAPAVLESQAVQALAAGQWEIAIQSLERLRHAGQLSSTQRLNLARTYLRVGRDEEALAEVQSVLGPQPMNLEALRLRGEIAAAAGDWSAARDAYAAVAERDPSDPGIYLSLGQALQALGDLEAAERAFARYARRTR